MLEDLRRDMAAVREDVAYLRGQWDAQQEELPDLKRRVTKLERFSWGIPGGILAALLAFFTN